MPLDLDTLEQRIIGVLIEKQLTVPDSYPLTLNGLVTGCNQKSNRAPTMSVEPFEVEGALRSLLEKEWVRELDLATGRTLRYAHSAAEQLAVEVADLALLSELLNRGPQAPGELKTRASRMVPFASPAEVEARLQALAARPVPYVERLERRPREHAPRWRHRLGGSETSGDEATAPAPEAPAPSAEKTEKTERPAWDRRLEDLERRVAEIERRIEGL